MSSADTKRTATSARAEHLARIDYALRAIADAVAAIPIPDDPTSWAGVADLAEVAERLMVTHEFLTGADRAPEPEVRRYWSDALQAFVTVPED